ncbi:unnamed protein product [Ceutorhynchus assimilis]|uniref:Uncharacterized protein n=1 Tax=Ceutorhynchus assimilis TaxID=467358 RepID=A0A9P0DFG9_9CUCU|nr:unnamed protein product [Ceutorhynchus assimilis]
MNANDQINDISLKTLRLKSSGIFHQLNITENNENTPPNINVLSEQNEETLHAPAKSLRPQLKHKSLRNNEEFEFSKADKSILPMDANKQLNDIFLNKTLRLKSSSILDQLNNTETDENTPPNIKVLSEQNEKTVHAPAKSIKPRLKHKSLKNNEEFDFTKADQPILPMDANKQINDISVKTLKSCGILDQPNNTETDENTPPNTKVLSDRNEETLHAPAKSLKPRSKNDEELEFSKADHYNPRDVKDQMIDISLKTLRLKSSGILDQLNKTDENTPPKTEVSTEKKEETLHASAESSRLSSNDCTYYHNTKETKISITTDSRAESSQQRATTSMPTAVFKKTDVCISFNFPNHFASTPIIHKTVKIKQINITDEISKIPKDLLSSKSNTLSLPNNYSSEETNECKDLAICDSKSENKKSSKGFVTVSSMTDLSLWTSMTRIFRTVFGGLHSRSKDVLDASSSNLNRDSFKRPLSESDSSPPHVKRFKFSDIKGRRPIREPFELPFRVALSRAPSSDRVATSGYARTVYEAGPRCKILWDRATQTDDYLMDGWQPQLK